MMLPSNWSLESQNGNPAESSPAAPPIQCLTWVCLPERIPSDREQSRTSGSLEERKPNKKYLFMSRSRFDPETGDRKRSLVKNRLCSEPSSHSQISSINQNIRGTLRETSTISVQYILACARVSESQSSVCCKWAPPKCLFSSLR